jgi:acyl carrier protein
MTIEATLRSHLAEICEQPELARTVGPDVSLVEDLGLSSLKMVLLLLRTEDSFDIEIDYETLDITDLSSLRRFCDYVHSRQQARKGA